MVIGLNEAKVDLKQSQYVDKILAKVVNDQSGKNLAKLVIALEKAKVPVKNHGTTILVKFNLDNSSIIEKIELVIILKRNNSGVGLTIALNPFWGDSLLENEFFKNQNNNEKEKNLNNKIDSNSNNEENVEI